MKITPKIIAETITTDAQWINKTEGVAYLRNSCRIRTIIEKKKESLETIGNNFSDKENYASPQEIADEFAEDFLNTISEDLTPRLIMALIDKLSDSLTNNIDDNGIGQDRIRVVMNKLNAKVK